MWPMDLTKILNHVFHLTNFHNFPHLRHLKLKRKEILEDILDDQLDSTRQGGFQKFHVKLKYMPQHDSTWIKRDESQHLNLGLLEWYDSFISPEVRSSQPRGNYRHIGPNFFKLYKEQRVGLRINQICR